MVILAIIICGITGLILMQILIKKTIKNRSKYLRNVPGPKQFLIFENYFNFIGGTNGYMMGIDRNMALGVLVNKVLLKRFLKYLDKYGDTVLFHDGTFSWVIVTVDYELTELILKSSTHIDKSDQYTYLHSWLGQGLLTTTGFKWMFHRKAITPSFHFSILQEYVGVFDSVGDALIKRLQKETVKDNTEISKIISLCTLDVMCEAAMGVKMNSLEHESQYIKNIKTMCCIITERMFSIVPRRLYPLTWKCYKEKRTIRVIHDYVDDVIVKRIEKSKREKNVTKNINSEKDEYGVKERLAFLDFLLKSTINGQPLTRKELRDEVNTFMFEGHDTTTSAISFSLLMIAIHQEVQEKLIKEQLEIFGKNLKMARPTYQQLNEMKYLDLVIKETLRLFPSVPYIARKLSKDLEFKGNLYPKGMPIVIFTFALQRNAKYFPEPEKFIPERFRNHDGKLPYSYTPFSAGPRNCIGQKFAMLEMLSIISKIIRNFEISPTKPEHKLQLAPELILISKSGVRISLKKRA